MGGVERLMATGLPLSDLVLFPCTNTALCSMSINTIRWHILSPSTVAVNASESKDSRDTVSNE